MYHRARTSPGLVKCCLYGSGALASREKMPSSVVSSLFRRLAMYLPLCKSMNPGRNIPHQNRRRSPSNFGYCPVQRPTGSLRVIAFFRMHPLILRSLVRSFVRSHGLKTGRPRRSCERAVKKRGSCWRTRCLLTRTTRGRSTCTSTSWKRGTRLG